MHISLLSTDYEHVVTVSTTNSNCFMQGHQTCALSYLWIMGLSRNKNKGAVTSFSCVTEHA